MLLNDKTSESNYFLGFLKQITIINIWQCLLLMLPQMSFEFLKIASGANFIGRRKLSNFYFFKFTGEMRYL